MEKNNKPLTMFLSRFLILHQHNLRNDIFCITLISLKLLDTRKESKLPEPDPNAKEKKIAARTPLVGINVLKDQTNDMISSSSYL